MRVCSVMVSCVSTRRFLPFWDWLPRAVTRHTDLDALNAVPFHKRFEFRYRRFDRLGVAFDDLLGGLQTACRAVDPQRKTPAMPGQYQASRAFFDFLAIIYGVFTGAKRHEGQAEGNITIFWFDHGWFWNRPMQGDVTSVGMVTWPYFMKTKGTRTVEQFLRDGIAMCPALTERMRKRRRWSMKGTRIPRRTQSAARAL